MPETKTIPIGQIKANPDNPRIIKDEAFKKLVKSMQTFPEMAGVRPVVCNTDMVILGGNMRWKAAIEAGWKEIPVQVVDWAQDKQREFIIKDNVSGGEWNWDDLANEWDVDLLGEWGLDLPIITDLDYSDKNEEIDTDNFSDKMTLKIELSEEDYHEATDRLKGISESLGSALMEVLRARA